MQLAAKVGGAQQLTHLNRHGVCEGVLGRAKLGKWRGKLQKTCSVKKEGRVGPKRKFAPGKVKVCFKIEEGLQCV